MNRKSAFTLIEMLVVIAIIAILAAIIFPVYMRTKEAAYRSGDMSNMNAIRNALQLYRADQEAYPPQILGYASFYDPGMTQVIPADQLRVSLFPKRVPSIKTLQPAYDRAKMTDLTTAQWPSMDPRAVGTAPVKDLDGNGVINANDDLPGARQLNGPGSYFCRTTPSCSNLATTTPADGDLFYKVSGFDAAEVPTPGNPVVKFYQLRYTLRWTGYAVAFGGNRMDDPRQLIYSDPPDDTVVTWDSWFREYDAAGATLREKKDFVLFLGGGARAFDSADINDRSWRVLP